MREPGCCCTEQRHNHATVAAETATPESPMQQLLMLDHLEDERRVQEPEVVILEEGEPPAATALALTPTTSRRRRRRPQLRSPHRQHRALESSSEGAVVEFSVRSAEPLRYAEQYVDARRSPTRDSPRIAIVRYRGMSSPARSALSPCGASRGGYGAGSTPARADEHGGRGGGGMQEAVQREYESALATSAAGRFEKYQEYIARRV